MGPVLIRSRSSTPRSEIPDSPRSGATPKAAGPTGIKSLEDMTELQKERQSLRTTLAEKDRTTPNSYREVAQPPTQTRQEHRFAAKSDVSVQLEKPGLVKEKAALWQAAKGRMYLSLATRGSSRSTKTSDLAANWRSYGVWIGGCATSR